MDVIFTVIRELRPWDVLDILIIAFLLYQLYNLLNYTRAIQLLKGVFVILVVWYLSNLMGLRMVHELLKTLLSFGAVAILVLFQPELRRALEMLGRNKLVSKSLFSGTSSREAESIEEIVTAVTNLSGKKIGALIVLAGDTGLADIIESGTELDADIKAPLLENIFFPKSPLHDGAVVINDGRIIAAGCLLPLSNDRSVSRDLGTRHRAALGMSANSDALVIVASEETGIITVAKNNQLERHLTADRLRQVIESFYQDEEKPLDKIFKGVRNEVE
ncbi:diadenylate cyclase CdaA [Guggenheimella bovis]